MKKIKFFSFFSFLFFVNSLLSQNVIDSTKFYFEQKNYDKALSYLLKHKDYVTLINHGVNFFEMNDFISYFLCCYGHTQYPQTLVAVSNISYRANFALSRSFSASS